MVSKADDEALVHRLFTAISAGNRSAVSGLLQRSPALARAATTRGATRGDPTSWFFERIHHYAYAGDTALHLAAAAHAPEIARELLARGASVEARNRRGAQPLHYAADGSPDATHWDPVAQSAVIRLLVEAGADPDSTDRSGVTPLHRAVRGRCASATGALLETGADPRGRNGSGSTPLHLAVQPTGRGGSGSAACRAQQAEIIALLLSHGARPSDRSAAGKTVRDCTKGEWIRDLLDNTAAGTSKPRR